MDRADAEGVVVDAFADLVLAKVLDDASVAVTMPSLGVALPSLLVVDGAELLAVVESGEVELEVDMYSMYHS